VSFPDFGFNIGSPDQLKIAVDQMISTHIFSFPAKKQRDGSDRQLAYPANAETRMLFQRLLLAGYEKLVGKEDPVPVPGVRSASERLRSLELLKTMA
jgi:hypothetical protein